MECAAANRKLAVDFFRIPSLRHCMDRDSRELLNRLCTEAGSRMEDASVVALTIGAVRDDDLEQALRNLDQCMAEMAVLISAARTLAE